MKFFLSLWYIRYFGVNNVRVLPAKVGGCHNCDGLSNISKALSLNAIKVCFKSGQRLEGAILIGYFVFIRCMEKRN